jgi:ribosomal protein L7/L12
MSKKRVQALLNNLTTVTVEELIEVAQHLRDEDILGVSLKVDAFVKLLERRQNGGLRLPTYTVYFAVGTCEETRKRGAYIACIKLLREVLKCGLKEAKTMLDGSIVTQVRLQAGLDRETAHELERRFQTECSVTLMLVEEVE